MAVPRGSLVQFGPQRGLGRAWRPRAVALSMLLALTGWPAAWQPAAHAQTPPAADPGSKAEMIYNAAKFIQWPGKSFTDSEGQFVFGILGEDPLAEALVGTLAGKTIAGRPVFVRFVKRIQDLADSQIAYIAQSEEGRLSEALGALKGHSVLTVADVADFIGRGGMVDFTPDADRVRFEIHRERAEKSGLKISSKLLSVARLVEPGS
jgi:uncharacterized protein DUF4154